MSLDLEQHLVFYGAYHNNSVNIFIHMVCVPIILITGICMASYSGTLISTPAWITPPYLELNLGTLAALLYAGLYILLEPVAGTTLAFLVLGSTAFGTYARELYPHTTFQVALGSFVVSWILQFIGHGSFEGRAPALLDNLFQALFLAPIFVWLEILFKLGYRPELRERVEKKIKVEIATFKKASNGKKAGDGKNGKAR